MTLTKEQWEDLAVFAGVGLLGEFGKDVRGGLYPIRWVGSFTNGWHPNSDWSDFGPLWMKLRTWFAAPPTYAEHCSAAIPAAVDFWEMAEDSGDQELLMQAGCLLGAAIGKTMRERN